MLNVHTGEIDEALLRSVGLRRTYFGRAVGPGTVVGTLTEEVRKLTGLGPLPVVAVAGHDTASAVAAVPAAGPHFAYLSSGTWSLMGIETPQAIVNEQSFSRNFTNEGGVAGTVRFLKNICGMWLYECCRREWKKEPGDVSHATLIEEAMKAEGFRSLINPDDPMFANPDSMTAAIQTYCRKHDEPVPEPRGRLARTALSAGVRLAEGICSVPDRCAPRDRWRFAKQFSQSVHGRFMQHHCSCRSSGVHGHR